MLAAFAVAARLCAAAAENLAEQVPTAAKPANTPLPLADKERTYLAEIEHRALTLSKKGFPAIKAALRDADAAKLTRMLAPSFRGEIADLSHGESPASTAVTIHRLFHHDSEHGKTQSVNAQEFVRYLVNYRKKFSGQPELEAKAVELAPVDREKMDGAWRGNFKLRIAGTDAAKHPLEVFFEIDYEFLRIADVEQIASDTGWIQSMRIVEGYEATSSHPLLQEVGIQRGLDRRLLWDNWDMEPTMRSIVSGGVFVADIDDDGRSDILVTDIKGLFLFHGLPGGRFEEITEHAGLPRKLGGIGNVAFGDLNNDGLVDAIIENRLFQNIGGARFEEITPKTNLKLGPAKYTSGYTLVDYDRDGLLDIYVARSFGPQGRPGQNSWIDGPGGPGNQLWRNLGNWQFEEVADKANARAGRRSAFTSSWLDANNDGWPDVYVINEFGAGILLLNQKDGTFKEVDLVNDAGDFGSMGLAVADIDNDGNVDVYTANMYSKSGRRIINNLAADAYAPNVMAKMKRFFPGSELYRNLGGLKFERAGKELHVYAVGWAYGPAFVDLDNDGFLDIYATTGFMSANKDEPDG